MRYAIIVNGPAGSGKSTFCASLLTHLQSLQRTAHLFNLDPAAEHFEHEPSIDIRDLISLEEVMEELGLGPNGGLVYCFEYLMDNTDWLEEVLGDYDDDYLIIDCPGQIELTSHIPILPRFLSLLSTQFSIRICSLYLLESQFIEDTNKYFSGVLSALSALVGCGTSGLCLMSKMDLVRGGRTGGRRREVQRFLDPDPELLRESLSKSTNPRFHALNASLVQLIEENNLIQFIPLDSNSEESIGVVLSHIDNALQYGEHEEPKEPRGMEGDGIDPSGYE